MAILQPEVPHYRTEFFQKLANNMKKLDIFIFNPLSSTKQSGFKVDFENLIYIANKKIKGVLIYNPFPILWKYDTLVLMLHFNSLLEFTGLYSIISVTPVNVLFKATIGLFGKIFFH